jgi:hypothetical protein
VFATHELNALADMMAERQLRMRKALDEMLEGWEMPKHEEESESEGEGSEIEHNAQELRRLMPY